MTTDQLHYAALPPGYQLHWYRIESILGQGGFGITYLATDTNLDTKVAIKEFLPTELAVRTHDSSVHPMSEGHRDTFGWGLSRFISEAKLLAQFQHPNIVTVHSVFEENHTAYMVMAYVHGQTLEEALKFQRVRTEQQLLDVLFPVLDGLEKIHQAGFIHRDIKPENIYLREDGTPLLLDFGSARQAVGAKTRTLTALVSPGYAPFEQYGAGGKVDKQGPWTDIYSLSATMYRAISGKAPADAMTRANSVIGDEQDIVIPAVHMGEGNYSKVFLEAIDHGVQFLPEKRPQSIAEWREMFPKTAGTPESGEAKTVLHPKTIEAAVLPPTVAEPSSDAAPQPPPEAHPTAAAPPAPVESPSPWAKRIAIGAVAVALVLGGVLGWQYLRPPAPQQAAAPDQATVAAPVTAKSASDEEAKKLAELEQEREVAEARMAEIQREAEEAARRLAEIESKRAAEEARQREESEQLQAEGEKRRSEEVATLAALEQRTKEEEARLAALERQRKEEEASTRAKLEQEQATAELERLQAEAALERQRAAEALRLAELEKQRKEQEVQLALMKRETEQAARELAELQRQREEAETASKLKAQEERDRLEGEQRQREQQAQEERDRLEGEQRQREQQAQQERDRLELAAASAREAEISKLLTAAEQDLASLRLTNPEGANAFERFSAVLALDAHNPQAARGLQRILDKYLELVDKSASTGAFARAEGYLAKAESVLPGAENTAFAREDLAEKKAQAERQTHQEAEREAARLAELQRQQATEQAALERQQATLAEQRAKEELEAQQARAALEAQQAKAQQAKEAIEAQQAKAAFEAEQARAAEARRRAAIPRSGNWAGRVTLIESTSSTCHEPDLKADIKGNAINLRGSGIVQIGFFDTTNQGSGSGTIDADGAVEARIQWKYLGASNLRGTYNAPRFEGTIEWDRSGAYCLGRWSLSPASEVVPDNTRNIREADG